MLLLCQCDCRSDKPNQLKPFIRESNDNTAGYLTLLGEHLVSSICVRRIALSFNMQLEKESNNQGESYVLILLQTDSNIHVHSRFPASCVHLSELLASRLLIVCITVTYCDNRILTQTLIHHFLLISPSCLHNAFHPVK